MFKLIAHDCSRGVVKNTVRFTPAQHTHTNIYLCRTLKFPARVIIQNFEFIIPLFIFVFIFFTSFYLSQSSVPSFRENKRWTFSRGRTSYPPVHTNISCRYGNRMRIHYMHACTIITRFTRNRYFIYRCLHFDKRCFNLIFFYQYIIITIDVTLHFENV